MAATALLVIAVAALPILTAEIDETNLTSDPKLASLKYLWGTVGQIPLVGYGAGTLPVVMAKYVTADARIDFAENLILDRMVSSGLLVGALVLGVLAWQSLANLRRLNLSLNGRSLVIAWIGFLVSNLVDFSFELAGPLTMASLIAASYEFSVDRAASEEKAQLRGVTRGHWINMGVAGLALAFCALLLGLGAHHRLTRDAPGELQDLDASKSADLVAQRFAYDEHALYLVGRKRLDAGDLPGAISALDAALALRPTSAHGRLVRFAARLEASQVEAAAEDLVWLLNAPMEVSEQALTLCTRSRQAEALLIEIMPKIPERGYELAKRFRDKRPDLVEHVAVELRKKYPGQVFAIEVLRAELYIARRALAPAKAISAALMVNPATRDNGWRVEGKILFAEGKMYEAYHIFRWLCEKNDDMESCVLSAQSILAAKRPQQALDYVRSMGNRFRSSPNLASVWWRFQGEALVAQESWPEALDALRNSHGLNSTDLTGSLLLALVLEKENLFGELSELTASLATKYGDDPRVKALIRHAEQAGQILPVPRAATATAAPP